MTMTAKEFWEEYYNKPIRERADFMENWYKGMDVGDKANVTLWSDVDPCTIIKKTATTLTVRYDKATKNPNWKPEWVVGGFSAICTNDSEQEWDIEEDLNGKVEVFRWHKNEGRYKNSSGCTLRPEWRKYYDYNF